MAPPPRRVALTLLNSKYNPAYWKALSQSGLVAQRYKPNQIRFKNGKGAEQEAAIILFQPDGNDSATVNKKLLEDARESLLEARTKVVYLVVATAIEPNDPRAPLGGIANTAWVVVNDRALTVEMIDEILKHTPRPSSKNQGDYYWLKVDTFAVSDGTNWANNINPLTGRPLYRSSYYEPDDGSDES